MEVPPADLTQLSKTHESKFPGNTVTSVLKFGNGPGAHGSADMPVWGPLFTLSLDKYHDSSVQQCIGNLVNYIEGLQAK